jgi:hypothetical protein
MENFGLDNMIVNIPEKGVSKFGLDPSGSGLDSAAGPVNTTVNTRLQNKKTSATSFSVRFCSTELADYNTT